MKYKKKERDFRRDKISNIVRKIMVVHGRRSSWSWCQALSASEHAAPTTFNKNTTGRSVNDYTLQPPFIGYSSTAVSFTLLVP